jgi:hypothetical protein
MRAAATLWVCGPRVEVLGGAGTILRNVCECQLRWLVGSWQFFAITTSKSMRGVRSRVESLYFMQRSVRAARSPRCANPQRASPGMCTDSERGGGRPGVPTLSGGGGSMAWVRGHDFGCPFRPSPSRLWLPVPAFAFTTLAARSGLRLHDCGCPFRPSPSRLWLPVPAFAFTTVAARSGLRLHDCGCPFRPSPSRLWLPVPAFAFTTLAARSGLRLHDFGCPFRPSPSRLWVSIGATFVVAFFVGHISQGSIARWSEGKPVMRHLLF